MGKDVEYGEVDLGDKEKEGKGLISQEKQQDIVTYCTLCFVVVVATLITILKIVLIDINDPDFASIFYPNGTADNNTMFAASTESTA